MEKVGSSVVDGCRMHQCSDADVRLVRGLGEVLDTEVGDSVVDRCREFVFRDADVRGLGRGLGIVLDT